MNPLSITIFFIIFMQYEDILLLASNCQTITNKLTKIQMFTIEKIPVLEINRPTIKNIPFLEINRLS